MALEVGGIYRILLTVLIWGTVNLVFETVILVLSANPTLNSGLQGCV